MKSFLSKTRACGDKYEAFARRYLEKAGLTFVAANVACLWLIAGHRHGGVHMRASYIFSANDVLANVGVLVAGALVAWSGSPIPDWVIGTAIAALVLLGAIRILRLRS